MCRSRARAAALGLGCLLAVANWLPAQDDVPLRAVERWMARPDAALVSPTDAGEPKRPRRRQPLQQDPYALVSSDTLLDQLSLLTAFKPHLGWRTSTTSGEAEAIGWVETSLRELAFLRSLGLDVQRESFRTFTGVEFWETSVTFRRDGVDFIAPADGSPGHRDWIRYALRFDSDGVLNDRNRDPVVVRGRPLVIRTADEIASTPADQVAGRVVLLDFAAIDRSIMTLNDAVTRAAALIEKGPAAIVMVTSASNIDGESHGSFAGDLSAYTWVEIEAEIPVLSLKIEDLEEFGIRGWNDLADVVRLIVRWDVDLFAPGTSSTLVARIPGRDHSRAVVLGAHIDSPNNPGA